MKRLRSPQPDLFKTSPAYEIPSAQRRMAVELLKTLLAEAITPATDAPNPNESSDNQELGDEQDHC
jgi:hypothetical protein